MNERLQIVGGRGWGMADLRRRYELDLQRRGLAASTMRDWHFKLLAFIRWLETQEAAVNDVTAEQIQRFLDSREIAARSRYAWVSMLHGFYQWGIACEEFERDPTERIVRPRFQVGLPRPMTDDDLTMALERATPQHRAALMLAAYAGFRCCEIAGLERSGVDDRAMTLRVIGKGGHEGVVAMRPDVWDALSYMGLPNRGRVFRRTCGQGFSPPQLSKWLNGYLHSVGITATAHQLRHWAGTKNLKAAGGNVRVTQQFMRHKSLANTQIYTKIDDAEVAASVLGMPTLAHPNEQRLPLAVSA